MSKTTFRTNPILLETLLKQCGEGKIQLPDFQGSWVWAEDRILSLIASISSAFPIGALMTLESRNGTTLFARRPLQGAPTAAKEASPDELLLDGRQRITSLFQSCLRREVVETITPKNKLVKRWFYIDIRKALEPSSDRDEAIFAVPEDRKLKTNFDKDIKLDLSTPEKEYEQLMFPLNRVFDWDDWQEKHMFHCIREGRMEQLEIFTRFKNAVLQNFKSYQVPVICLDHETSHEAVCLVFEKVNTGGKALDAFELLTAMYAAKGHKLRDDWLGAEGKPGMHHRLAVFGQTAGQETGVLAKVASTDVLQAIALCHTKRLRQAAIAAGVKENDLPAVRASRQSLLDLPLEVYLEFRDSVEDGFKRAAKFLRQQEIHRVIDLPYQTQLVPMAAIFSEIGDAADHAGNVAKISRWFWCEVFDTVINKTPLSYRTNRIIGGVAPSKYLATLEAGKIGASGLIEEPSIAPDMLNSHLASHCLPVAELRAYNFEDFMRLREKALLKLISTATGQTVNEEAGSPDEGEELPEDVAQDSGLAKEDVDA